MKLKVSLVYLIVSLFYYLLNPEKIFHFSKYEEVGFFIKHQQLNAGLK